MLGLNEADAHEPDLSAEPARLDKVFSDLTRMAGSVIARDGVKTAKQRGQALSLIAGAVVWAEYVSQREKRAVLARAERILAGKE